MLLCFVAEAVTKVGESIWYLDKVSLKMFERNAAMVTMVPVGEIPLPYKY